MTNLLIKPETSDADLIKIAKIIGLKNLRICYAAETDKKYHGPQIVNLDHVGGRGTHWCCYYDGLYFDPLGCPPPPSIEKLKPDYAEIQVQPVHEAHCGQYSLFWALAKQKNKLGDYYESYNLAQV